MEDVKSKKEKVREYMERRKIERRDVAYKALHGIEQIRRELGWDLIHQRQHERRKK